MSWHAPCSTGSSETSSRRDAMNAVTIRLSATPARLLATGRMTTKSRSDNLLMYLTNTGSTGAPAR